MPAFGKPTNPASASILSLKIISASCPFSPGVALRGALFVEDLKLIFPIPPFPPGKRINFSSSTMSAIISSLRSISVPTGIFKIKSLPAAPVLFLPEPPLPFCALKCFWYLKSTRVLRDFVPSNMISPPLPPFPPSGPPNSIYFSLLKLRQPSPPSPLFTKIFASSINFILEIGFKKVFTFKLWEQQK